MEQKFTLTDIIYLYNLAGYKTDEELATIIKKPVAYVQMLFALISGLPKRPWEMAAVIADMVSSSAPPVPAVVEKIKRISHAERKVIREQKKAVAEQEKREKQSLHAQEQDRIKERSKKLARGTFKTKKLDLTGKKPFKLNAKTIVWAKPETDVEELKRKYKIA